MSGSDKDTVMAESIARAVAAKGGRAYYVGGCVRDMLMGNVSGSKDLDIEVHGLTPETLEKVLGELGEVTKMGQSFGVFGLRHHRIDIAMPRKERATGRGHKDFEVYVDPYIGPEKAACRRDFTVNAFMCDILTGEVLDFFGGREDLAAKVIRHVSDETFVEDPLRAYRAAQFATRFGFAIAPETVKICSEMDVSALSRERVMGETEKALVSARKTSVYFTSLAEMDQLRPWFPELGKFGNKRSAACRFIDRAAKLRDSVPEPLRFMCEAVSIGADGAGWLQALTNEQDLLKGSREMLEAYRKLAGNVFREDELILLLDTVHDPDGFVKLAELASGTLKLSKSYKAQAERLDLALPVYKVRVDRGFPDGAELIERGIRPGKGFSDAVAAARKVILLGGTKEEATEAAIETAYAAGLAKAPGQ